jgi:hypothetical protein
VAVAAAGTVTVTGAVAVAGTVAVAVTAPGALTGVGRGDLRSPRVGISWVQRIHSRQHFEIA